MKKLHLAIFLAPTILFCANAHAQSVQPEARMLVHSVRQIVENGPKLAGWLVEPNVLDSAHQLLGVIGPRFENQNFWIELLGGTMANPIAERPFSLAFDVRASYTGLQHLHFWGETTLFLDALYGFGQVDVPVRVSGQMLAKVGVQAEGAKAFRGTGGFVGVGPELIIPWGDHLATVLAYQRTCSNDGSKNGCTSIGSVARAYIVFEF